MGVVHRTHKYISSQPRAPSTIERSTMGLRHDALHAILANPTLSSLDLVEGPGIIEWLLIDHLIVVHRIRSEDLVEGERELSIRNMALRLANIYTAEAGTHNMVLVKDGPGLQKPYVADARRRSPTSPHIVFCRDNLEAIESLALSMLWGRGIPVFLVVGAVAYAASSEQNKAPVVRIDVPQSTQTTRPDGYKGVYIVGGDGTEGPSADLSKACAKCSTVEADTLMMELARALPGDGLKVLCTADTDLLALLTAHGSSGVVVRLENKSYRLGREMHESKFPDLLHAGPIQPDKRRQRGRVSIECESRRGAPRRGSPALQDLIDIGDANIDTLLPDARVQHLSWEQALGDSSAEVLDILLRCGIRGSLYRHLMIFSGPSVVQNLLAEIGGRMTPHKVCSRLFVENRRLTRRAMRLAQRYAAGLVPPESYARFLKLSKSGKYFYWRVKRNVDHKERCRGLVFMALCGTDFNITPQGLGIKALTTAALGHFDDFTTWCETHGDFLLGDKFPPPALCSDMCTQLARLTGSRKTAWPAPECRAVILTTKFVLRHWLLKCPCPGPVYGFRYMDEEKAVFDLDAVECEGGVSTAS